MWQLSFVPWLNNRRSSSFCSGGCRRGCRRMSWKMTVFNQFGAISVKLFTCNSNQPAQFIWAPSPQWPFSRPIRRNGGRPLGAQLNGHQPESREQFMQGFDHFSSSHTGRRVPSLPPTLDLCYLRMYVCITVPLLLVGKCLARTIHHPVQATTGYRRVFQSFWCILYKSQWMGPLILPCWGRPPCYPWFCFSTLTLYTVHSW